MKDDSELLGQGYLIFLRIYRDYYIDRYDIYTNS